MAKNYVDNLGEEVKKGMREKAEHGHWPSMAPIGYINNPATHRIEPDPVRAPLMAEVFRLYGSGAYSLKGLLAKAHAIGLTHPRTGRRLFKSELHRLLHNSIYTGDFVWDGKAYKGSHQPVITREAFDEVQAVLRRKPRARYPKQRYALTGLLRCARCGCVMTAERKKGKYIYYAAPATTAPAGTPTSARNSSPTCWAASSNQSRLRPRSPRTSRRASAPRMMRWNH